MNLIRTTKTAEAVEIAIANAQSAIDQRHEYTDPVSSYRINVVDTLVETGLLAFHHEALAAYDAYIKANWPLLSGPDAFALLRSTNPGQRLILTYSVVAPIPGELPDVEGIYQDFATAAAACEASRLIYPERDYSVVVSFIRLVA